MPKPSKNTETTENFEPSETDIVDSDDDSDFNEESDDELLSNIDDEEDDEENNNEEDEDIILNTDIDDEDTNIKIVVPNEERITRPFLTKYEKVRVIGTRRKQLYLGAKPMIKIEGNLTIEEIVDLELKEKMIPFKIRRPLPSSNKVEIWKLSELEIINY